MDLIEFLEIAIEFLNVIFASIEMLLVWLNNTDIFGFSMLVWVYAGIVFSFVLNLINSLSEEDIELGGTE